jgi:hypothetical protein
VHAVLQESLRIPSKADVERAGAQEPHHRIAAEPRPVHRRKADVLARVEFDVNGLPDKGVVDPKPMGSRFELPSHRLSEEERPGGFFVD